LVTGMTLGTLRNNYSGWVGMRLQVGASPLTVQSLGRIFVNGNTANHELRLVLATTKATVASVVWTPSSGVHNQIKYAPLTSAVTLTANTEYYLASQEVSGGDQWYSWDTTVTTTSAAAALSGIYSPNATTWTPNGTAGHTYVPVSLQYCGTAASVESGAPLSEGADLQARLADSSGLNVIIEGGTYANKKAVLRLAGEAGERYVLQSSDNLINWSPLSTNVIQKRVIDVHDTNAGRNHRFYRLVPVSDVADE
jgi:hypothetical protein